MRRKGERKEEIEGKRERMRWMGLGGNREEEGCKIREESDTEGGTEVARVLEDTATHHDLPSLTDTTLCGVSRHQAECH